MMKPIHIMISKFNILKVILIFCFLFPNNIHLQSIDDPLDKPEYYVNEVCSYNQKHAEIMNSLIKCECNQGFINSTGNNKFGRYEVQCNYAQKRKFIAFFFSIFFLFGLEYLYLERYLEFSIILIFYLFVIFGNCYFAIVTKFKKDNERFMRKIRLFFKLSPIILLCWWIVNNILILTGKITDGNSKAIYDDVAYLFSF